MTELNTMPDYDILASLLEYPQENYKALLQSYQINLPDNKNILKPFIEYVNNHSFESIQELYTQTFDVNPICSLYSGIHIFGEENFNRGAYMARLKQAYQEHGLNCEPELPDFIPWLLRLSKRLKDEKKYTDLLNECILPPIDSILKTLNESPSPYKTLILSVKNMIEKELHTASEIKEVKI